MAQSTCICSSSTYIFTPCCQLATDAPDTPHEEQCMPSQEITIFKSRAVYYVKPTDHSVYTHFNGRWVVGERRGVNDSFRCVPKTSGSTNASLPIHDTNNDVMKHRHGQIAKNKTCNTLWRSIKHICRLDNDT